jgi:hypothetical protein
MVNTHTQLTEDVVVCLGWVRVSAHGTLDDGQTQTPDITLNTVGTATGVGTRLSDSTGADAFGSHV